MKTLLTTLTLAAMAGFALATDIGLKWNPNPVEDHVIRYEVTYHTGLGTEPVVVDVPAPAVRVTILGLVPGETYYFVVRAANEDGISEPSDELEYRIPKPPAMPTGLGVEVVLVEESTDNLTTWQEVVSVPLRTADKNRFLRASIVTLNL